MMIRGLILNRCVHTKVGMKDEYATSHAKVRIHKYKLWWENVHTCTLTCMRTNISGKWRYRRAMMN